MLLSVKTRAQLQLSATTSLSSSEVLDIIRNTAGAVKGDRMNPVARMQNTLARVNIERESDNRLVLSVTWAKRLAELCTFSARVATSPSDGKTTLHLGGLETYKTSQSKLLMIIPLGPKSILGYDQYKRFLEDVASTLRQRDPSAQVSVEMPSAQ